MAALRPGDATNGKTIYTGACMVCHGANGKGGSHGGAPLTDALTRDAIVTIIASGRNQMPAFGSAVPPQDREDLAAYVLEFVK